MSDNRNEFFHSINQFTRHFSKALNEALVPLGLYSAQWTIIYLLNTNGPSSQKELAQYLGVEAPTMTRTLSRLESAGWITKEMGADRREKRIILTEAAVQQFDGWLQAVRTCENNILKKISEEELLFTQSIIRKMSEGL
ncbi:DNA-binding MarR family transcriptional regulator [Cytobacillus eiseniae]|uniref:DNA-binding MarR family transcriptional regulator n=1 Tax=Cytobacillus eiseniae TaxID=762947 RepID=A0ABS4RGL7_9BACI|nr:MarR family transcriptional regulator [Cytobacillus eiseniae]MBP2241879.1 DNA-binding MarR family transcriptional regulator [Cytobacillus eiseniae]